MTRPYSALVRVAWAAVYASALIVLYGWFDPLRVGSANDPTLFVVSLAAGVLIVVLARATRTKEGIDR